MELLEKTVLTVLLLTGLLGGICAEAQAQQDSLGESGWISLFDGESLSGWKASESDTSFTVKNRCIVAHGPRSHLFYVGPLQNHSFDNFALRADVMTTPGSNSGIYFHTEYQEKGWPSAGYEVQINNSYASDPRRTGSLYAIQDTRSSPVDDNEWFTIYIRVEGRHVVVEVGGEEVVSYNRSQGEAGENDELRGGTFALQAHDPESKVYFRNIQVKPHE